MTLPPFSGSKKFPPKSLSNISSTSPTVIAGKANKMSPEVTKVVQANRGIRINVIPGALMLMMVTRKLIPPIRVPMPEICRPMT
ncbi:hypothetical protein D3C73_1581400 [compost metagenome]